MIKVPGWPKKSAALCAAFISIFFTIFLFFAVEASSQERETVKFSYSPNTAAQTICVAGTFNGWSKEASPMKETGGGVWETSLEIPAGSHQYKFVINGSVWVSDPSNPETADDGQGGKNSVINAGRGLYERLSKISPKDHAIETDGLAHKPAEVKYLDFTGKDRARIVLRSFKNDLDGAYILKAAARGPKFKLEAMKKFACDGIYDYYKTYFDGCDSRSVYLFKAVSGSASSFLGFKAPFEAGRENSLAANAFSVPDYFFKSINQAYWWPDAIFYQIFPDRFYDAAPSLNQKFVQPWGSAPALDNFTGGDIAGITAGLPHIKALGASALYLNPIFKSFSNHKYDTVDYFQIDPTLGEIKDFTGLVSKAHENGMKIILDAVFNHTSTDFFAFADAREKGAKSPYAGWYNFKSFPVNMAKPNYDCWWNIGSMPKLNIKNEKVYEYLLSVARRWMEFKIDGFRLDVPEELPHSFWKDFRKTVKKADPAAYIVGEIWADGSKWLTGDQFDGIMNYKLRNDLISFFVKKEIKAAELDARLAYDKVNLPDSAFYSMLNLLGSHDTPRILTVCGGNLNALKSMVAFIMAYPGAPCIYYGDEIGLEGGKDPDNRRCMVWDKSKWNMEIFDFYQKATRIRNSNIELRRGELYTWRCDNAGLYSFIRTHGGSCMAAAFNNSTADISLRADFKELFSYSDSPAQDFKSVKFATVTNLFTEEEKKYDVKSDGGFNMSIKKEGFAIYRIRFEMAEK